MVDKLLIEYEKIKCELEYNKAKEKLDNSLKLYRFVVNNRLSTEIDFVHQRIEKHQIEFEKAVLKMGNIK